MIEDFYYSDMTTEKIKLNDNDKKEKKKKNVC